MSRSLTARADTGMAQAAQAAQQMRHGVADLPYAAPIRVAQKISRR
jgi:hypothetical protein